MKITPHASHQPSGEHAQRLDFSLAAARSSLAPRTTPLPRLAGWFQSTPWLHRACPALLAAAAVLSLAWSASAQPEQSPIDLRSPDTVFTNALPALDFEYGSGRNLSMVYDDHGGHANIGINAPPGAGQIKVNGVTYQLFQFHFHYGAEHLTNGHRAAMELHLVHQACDGSLLVVGRLIEPGASNSALAAIFGHLPQDAHAPPVQVTNFNLNSLLPAVPSSAKSFRYRGSLTTPPYGEGVQWVVLAERLTLDPAQIAAFTNTIHEANSREPKPLYGRTVLTDVPGFAATNTANITVTTIADGGPGSLRQALVDAGSDGTITFAPALNGGTISLTSGQLVIGKNVNVIGPGADQLAVSGNGLGRVFSVPAGVSTLLSGLTVTGGQISSAERGAGILNRGNLTLWGCTVSSNRIVWNNLNDPNGGGIMNENSATLKLVNCTVVGNQAYYGGGIYNTSAGSLEVTQSTISGNIGLVFGGGILTWGPATLRSVTVVSNLFQGLHLIGATTIQNCLLADNRGGNCYGAAANLTSLGYNLSSDATANLTAASDLSNTNPLLGPLTDNGGPTWTHALLIGSPAINAGTNAPADPPPTDQRGSGYPRLAAGTQDIGAFEAPLTVTNLADSGPGSLRQALTNVSPGGVIYFAPALNGGTISLTSGELVIAKNLSLIGPGANLLSVSGRGLSRVFSVVSNFPPVIATLAGLTITNGNGMGASLAGSGGGVLNHYCCLTVSNCTLIGNSATSDSGGGIMNLGSGGLASLTLLNSTVTGNRAQFYGGGAFSAGAGGKVTMTIHNSTLSGNTAAGVGGGGIWNEDSTLVLTSSTLTGNRATASGAIGAGLAARGIERITNTIVAGNLTGTGTTPNDIRWGSVDSASHTLVGDAASAPGVSHGFDGNQIGNGGSGTRAIASILDTNLAFNGGPTRTHRLVTDSPALDVGTNAVTTYLRYDQRGIGFDRAANGIVDIGAYEMAPPVHAYSSSTPQGYRLAVKGEPHEALEIHYKNELHHTWRTLHTGVTDAQGKLEHTDTSSPGVSRRFYRYARP